MALEHLFGLRFWGKQVTSAVDSPVDSGWTLPDFTQKVTEARQADSRSGVTRPQCGPAAMCLSVPRARAVCALYPDVSWTSPIITLHKETKLFLSE